MLETSNKYAILTIFAAYGDVVNQTNDWSLQDSGCQHTKPATWEKQLAKQTLP